MSENKTKEYEIFYLTSIALSPEEITAAKKQVSDIIIKYNGTIISEEDMGKKKLAYMVEHTRHGYFIYTVFNAPTDKINQIKKEITLIPEILRYRLVIKEKVDKITIPAVETAHTSDKLKPQTTIRSAEKNEVKPEKVDLKELDLKIDQLLSDENI